MTSSSGFSPSDAYKEGWDFAVPLITAVIPSGRKPRESTESFFSLNQPDVVILAFKPFDDGNRDHYMLPLQEIAGHGQIVALRSSLNIEQIDETRMTEDAVLHAGIDMKQIQIGAHQALTLLLTISHQTSDWTEAAK